MGFLTVVLLILAALLIGHLFSRIGELKSSVAELERALLDRIRSLESNAALQNQAIAQLRETAHTQTANESPAVEPGKPVEPQAPAAVIEPVPETVSSTVLVAESLPTPASVSGPAEPQEPMHATTYAAPAPPPPHARVAAAPTVPPAPAASPTASLEERLGTNWIGKLGIASLVIGLAFLLATHLGSMGPGGKVLTGIGISLGLLGGGLWLERKQPYRVFARLGIGGGWALLFFTTYAMHHVDAAHILDSLITDLILMLIVAAGMVLHSLRYNSQTVTGLAFLLGYATLATSHFESASGTIAFSLLASAILAIGLVIVTTRRHWAWLELAGLIAVYANHFLWLSLILPATRSGNSFPFFLPSAALIVFYWALFRAAYLLRKPLNAEEDRISSLSAILNAGGLLGLLKYQSTHPEWAFRALLILGSIEVVLAFWSRPRRRSAFIVLSTIGTVLLVAAVPFQFHGVSWPILWLVEAHVLALCGIRLGEPIFRRLGLLAGIGSALVLAFHDLLPLAEFRLSYPDPSHHPSLATALALAAALFWIHGELYPRRWPTTATSQKETEALRFESIGLKLISWLGLASAAAALWVVLPTPWIAVGFMSLVILLGLIADWRSILSLALQADLLAALAVPALTVWDFAVWDYSRTTIERVPAAITICLFYAAMRRRTKPAGWPAYIAPAYSWVATLFLLYWIEEVIADQWHILCWTGIAFVLFEAGRALAKPYLRWQGIVPAIVAVGALQLLCVGQLFKSQIVHGWSQLPWPQPLSLLCAVFIGYWVQERTAAPESIRAPRQLERIASYLLGAAATLSLLLWLPSILPSWGSTEAQPILWASLATLLLAVALLTKRRIFQIHATVVTLFPFLFSLYLATGGSPQSASLPWWQTNLARMAIASALLLSGLAFAYPLRRLNAKDYSSTHNPWTARSVFLLHPEQWFFFVPFAVMIITLAAELRSGNITLGWSLLGLGSFIFALIVGERSFRLAGLALLLLSVVKILLMDVWTLRRTDRYITLIVMGCVLLLVSFLYTRFRSIFQKYL